MVLDAHAQFELDRENEKTDIRDEGEFEVCRTIEEGVDRAIGADAKRRHIHNESYREYWQIK